MRLTVRQLTKAFGEKQVLRGLDFATESGTALGLLGRNGAGKTTVIRIVMGVFPADSGEILLDGQPLDRAAVRLGYLPEERGLYVKKPILDQLVYFARLRGLTAAESRRNARYWLERVGLAAFAHKRLDTLSKGNQQKIQLVAALQCDPAILILDEPFSGLDPVNARLLKDIVKEEIGRGKMVFFSSHQMNYIEEFCDQIAILNGGHIVLSGGIREIKRSYERNRLLLSGPALPAMRDCILSALSPLVKEMSETATQLSVTLTGAQHKRDFIAALVERNFDFDAIQVYEPSLSDIFVEYTEENL
ncbi:MAG: ATP-binding cassette domain-containing protein [Oscillospiraceae bacterium]|jgi:ABC-2 type transport system ATP-binding protein|nr:ATP-binding cassette domain-containing protein [Oscillospiraceae bacterium]